MRYKILCSLKKLEITSIGSMVETLSSMCRALSSFPWPCNEEDEECMRVRREIPISVAYKTTSSQSHPQKNA